MNCAYIVLKTEEKKKSKLLYLSGYLNGLGTLSRSGVLIGELGRTIIGRFNGGVFGSSATTIFSANSFIGAFDATVSSLMADFGNSAIPSIDETIICNSREEIDRTIELRESESELLIYIQKDDRSARVSTVEFLGLGQVETNAILLFFFFN